MANLNKELYAVVKGELKPLAELYMVKDGKMVEILAPGAVVNGIVKPFASLAIIYTWKKYKVVSNKEIVYGDQFSVDVEEESMTFGGVREVFAYGIPFPTYEDISIDSEGKITLKDEDSRAKFETGEKSDLYDSSDGSYFSIKDADLGNIGIDTGSGYAILYKAASTWEEVYNDDGYAECRVINIEVKNTQGDYIGDVTSENENAYPNNGIQDGYWYVKQ